MRYVPHGYQRYVQEQILRLPAVGIFLDMGMGKTVATLTAVDALLFDRFAIRRVLVIAPLLVAAHTWSAEAAKWDHLRHLRISRVLGSAKERAAALAAEADIYVINRENVPWLVERYGARWPFDMVVIDELSSFKNPSAKRFKALRRVRKYIGRIVGLTGTPSPNGLMDLWAQVFLLDQGERLGRTLGGYRERYFLPDKRNAATVFSWKPRDGSEQAIHEKLKDICVSMSAADYLELPERFDLETPVHLPAGALEQYRRLERELLLPFADGNVVALTAAALGNKLLQIANGAAYDDADGVREIHRAKIDALQELVEQANGKPVLVYYAYQHDRERILAAIPEARELDVEAWNRGEQAVAVAHPASAGHGLNLQRGGSVMVWFGLTWNLEHYQQANARLHRQGQREPVRIYHLIAKGTIDEQVMKALRGKAAGQDALLEALKARIQGWKGE